MIHKDKPAGVAAAATEEDHCNMSLTDLVTRYHSRSTNMYKITRLVTKRRKWYPVNGLLVVVLTTKETMETNTNRGETRVA